MTVPKFPPFTLHPFHPAAENPMDIRITGRISRDSETLAICYQLSGEYMAVDLPGLSDHPVRKDFLWRETCLELFVRKADAETYREINLSPAGHWNIYRFDGYRKGMREEMGITAPIVHVDDKNPGVVEVSTRIHLEGIIPSHPPIPVRNRIFITGTVLRSDLHKDRERMGSVG